MVIVAAVALLFAVSAALIAALCFPEKADVQTHLRIDLTLTLAAAPSLVELARVLVGGMSEADVRAVVDRLKADHAKLSGLAADPNVPPAP